MAGEMVLKIDHTFISPTLLSLLSFTMLPPSESLSQELAVNFFCRETWAQERINVWKVQGAPPASVQVGQTIWFHSNIFVMGGDFGKYVEAVKEGQLTGKYRYEGEILHIVGW